MNSNEPENSDRQITDRLNPYYGENLTKAFTIRALAFVLFLGVAYFFRPLFHGVVYGMLYSVDGAIVGALTTIVFVTLWFAPRFQDIPFSSQWEPRKQTNNDEPYGFQTLKSVIAKTGAFVILWLVFSITYSLLAGLLTWVLAAALPVLAIGLLVRLRRARRDPEFELQPYIRPAAVAGLVVLLFTVSIFMVYASGHIQQREMATGTMENANNVSEFPQVNEQNPRIVPREVDKNQVKGSVSYRQHRLGASDVARTPNGSMAWSYAIEPDDTRNKLLENQRGVALSDMTKMTDRELQFEDDERFPIGEGMYLHRSSRWNLVKTDYLSLYNDDSVRFVHNGDAYMSYPKTGHEWRVEMVGGIIPVPYTVPVSNGVGVIDTNGDITHYTLTEAQNEPLLDGQRLYPLDVTRKYMESLGYRNGIINQLEMFGSHRGEVELADLPAGAGNQQPFIIDMQDEQFSYVIALEPYGEDTRGLDEVWFANAETGEYTYYETGQDNTLLGPERAMGLVRSEDSQTGWGDDFEVVEPIPTVIDGELYWHSKVVPTDNLDVTRNVFVNAHSGETVELLTTDAVRKFMAGEDIENINETVDEVEKQPADDDPDIAYVIIVKNADGEVIERIEVAPDEEVTIEADTNSTTTGNETTT